ncbi:MAG: helix-turn-helix transcriptional regulator [Bacteroidota bacterium]
MNIKLDYPNKTRSDFLESLVKSLIRRRQELNITQEELNHTLGVADRLVSKWECGTRTPLAFHLYCWADALQTCLTIVPKRQEVEGVVDGLKLKAVNDNFSERSRAANDNALKTTENDLKIPKVV